MYNDRTNKGYKKSNHKGQGPAVRAKEIRIDNFSDMAEKVMDSYGDNIRVTSSQIRPFLAMVNHIAEGSVKAQGPLTDIELGEIQYLKTRLVYSAGKERDTATFVEKADILAFLDRITQSKDREEIQLLGKYFESLVAFHKFKGGRD
ncbi:CRISPR type III-A/MTUBE-associated protein Csm2 [Aedoeadaptatus ivorii]|uniref:CRISPR system Cms protein Csm2 n=1 Tax=Aedoeadaptatus ivorii TaxID=54006 RepID=A0A448UZX7_9FIRM|nr:CRISPR type III-A/MTUBE-associated protein Csm2 [Peptoniphilus ivorii]